MTQFVHASDGTRIAYETSGAGTAIVLVHGFASDRVQNWRAPGWYETLNGAGCRVIALDCRGHGESDKPHDAARYDHDIMARDVIAVMDAEGLGETFLMGYSMGGYISMHLLVSHASRVKKLVIGGVGETYFGPTGADGPASISERNELIAAALLEPDKTRITSRVGRDFRAFAEQPGKDRVALAACMRADRKMFSREALSRGDKPVLVVCGENDVLTGSPDPLASAFTRGRAVTVPKRDHMTTVGDKIYKQAVLEFLKE